ncbi:MAG TPA: phosphoribosylamine--glycine ligase, partial [Actinomycetota bacterium]|nr:phosphoribosylamine--glycine ligase [Actinomycetota bacterium]
EHALAWRLARSPSVDAVCSAPGNPGMAELGPTVPIAVHDLEGLARYASEHEVDLTVVGPEVPLVAGIVDLFSARGLRVFGPRASAARIEGSKVWCRELAERYGVPMARGRSFDAPEPAARFAAELEGPVVVKAEGLAAGKGVRICADAREARAAIDEIMRGRLFGDAGSRVVVEEYLSGRETSLFCLTDGHDVVVLEPAQDYKRALDGDGGLNTGGMGSYSPVPWLPAEVRERAVNEIVRPLLDGLAAEGAAFTGCFYAGLMVDHSGAKLIEVNCRFGDPETQVLMPRLESDLGELLTACAGGSLGDAKVSWRPDACVSVVLASGGYPGEYRTGLEVSGVQEAESMDGVAVFHAGTSLDGSRLVSSGGRVLNVSALGTDIADARSRAYAAAALIEMEGQHLRTDIALGV